MTARNLAIRAGLAAAAVTLFAAAVVGANPSDPHLTVRLSRGDAVMAVRNFAADATLVATGPVRGKSQHYFRVDGEGVTANVDAHDGTVRTLGFTSSLPSTRKVVVSSIQARDAADAYIAAHLAYKARATPTVSLIDRGAFQEYLVEWQSRVNGALVPDYMSVSINPETGAVFAMTDFTRAYVDPSPPEIDPSEAEEIAQQALEPSRGWQARSAELRVDFDEDGAQTLVWLVILDDQISRVVWVEVDAISGAAMVVAHG